MLKNKQYNINKQTNNENVLKQGAKKLIKINIQAMI